VKRPKPLIVQAYVEAGALKVPSKAMMLSALKGWPDCPVSLTIEVFEETRRACQNRWLWGVLYKEIASETGYSVDDVHELMKIRHNSKTVVDPGTGEEVKIGLTTTTLKVGEFSIYIEKVMLDGAEWCGIIWPEPRTSEEWRNASSPQA